MLSPTKLDILRGKAGAVLNSTFPFTKETLVDKYSVIFLYQSCNSKLTQFVPKYLKKKHAMENDHNIFFSIKWMLKYFSVTHFGNPSRKNYRAPGSLQAFHLILRFWEQSCIQQEVRGEVTIKHWACFFPVAFFPLLI